MKKKAYLGIDIGSISTKGVIINENKDFLAECYLWTEGNPTEATKKVLTELQKNFDGEQYEIVASGTTGSARKLVGSMIGAQVVKNEITAHAVGTTSIHPDVRTILEIGGQDSKIICVENGVAVDYAMNTLAPQEQELFFPARLTDLEWKWKISAGLPCQPKEQRRWRPDVQFLQNLTWSINSRLDIPEKRS